MRISQTLLLWFMCVPCKWVQMLWRNEWIKEKTFSQGKSKARILKAQFYTQEEESFLKCVGDNGTQLYFVNLEGSCVLSVVFFCFCFFSLFHTCQRQNRVKDKPDFTYISIIPSPQLERKRNLAT